MAARSKIIVPDGPRAVVFFSGAAGSSIGARAAGARVVAGVNHNELCVAVHAANFPDAQNIQQDLHLYNHAALPFHDGLIASPVCRANSQASRPGRARAAGVARSQGHSEAAASARLASAHNAYGALPWAIMDSLEVNRPRWFVIENVPAWRTDWPLYRLFIRMLKRLGYKVTEQVLDALAWGIPQQRERLFVIGTLGPKPIRVRDPKGVKPRAMHDFVDWDGGDWMSIRSCPGEKARAQLRRADREFKGGPAFIQLVSHRPAFPSSEPLRTMTRQDQVRWVYKGRYKYPTAREGFNLMGFPADYVIPDAVAEHRTTAWAMAGDAVCPGVMQGIIERVTADA
jgi:DNA (cytosine-5)-methyltransferase 1